MSYLINNIDLILAVIYSLIKMSVIGFVLACSIQTAVYQLSNKRISLYNIFEKHMLSNL